MATEIERKFLIRSDDWRALADDGEEIRQGYLVADAARSVRIRLRAGRGTLTVKGPTEGAVRPEFEYEIPADDARTMLDDLALRPQIDKRRYLVDVDGWTFEVDEFYGDNAGLLLAEIELPAADADHPRPAWLGDEVTDDPRYYNASLARRPYATWS